MTTSPSPANMTETPPTEKAKRQTWRDWMPPMWDAYNLGDPPLITRAELIDALRAENLDVSERTLRFWEQTGLLPRPTRGEQSGHGRGGPTLYPYWMPMVTRQLIHLRSAPSTERLGAEGIRQRMRLFFRGEAIHHAITLGVVRMREIELIPCAPTMPDLPKDLKVALTSYLLNVAGADYRGTILATLTVQDDLGKKIAGYDIAVHD